MGPAGDCEPRPSWVATSAAEGLPVAAMGEEERGAARDREEALTSGHERCGSAAAR